MLITTQPADAGDAAAISRLYARSWREAYSEIVEPGFLQNLSDDHWTEAFAGQFSSGAAHGLLALADGALAGAAILCPSRDDRRPGAAEIQSFYIDPTFYRQGVGTALMRACLDALAQKEYPEAFLWVVTGNEHAMAFYRHCGFRPDGDRLEVELAGKVYTDLRYSICL